MDLRHESKEFISYCNGAKLSYIAFERRENISHECKRVYRKKEVFMNDKTIKELAVELTVEITEVCDNIKGRSVFTNQLLRSCSSIGANSHEAKYAQSKADFHAKMNIALKEASETEYWLELLTESKIIVKEQADQLLFRCRELLRMLTSIVKNSVA